VERAENKKTSRLMGAYFAFRSGKKADAFRAWVVKDNCIRNISIKFHPTLRKINQFLSDNKLRKEHAELNHDFINLKFRLERELQSEFDLRPTRLEMKVKLKTKEHDFEDSLERFELWKKRTSVSYSYRRTLESFWFPFLIGEMKCVHPSEFADCIDEIYNHVLNHKTRQGEAISFHSYNGYFKALNQYLDFCQTKNIISSEHAFKVWHHPTLEEKKRGQLRGKRKSHTFSIPEMVDMKAKIDLTYGSRPKDKLLAYGMYFGVCSGLRRGNILGLKAKDLFPEDDIPHFRVSDNVVSGYSRGVLGQVVFENSTKTTSEEDGEILLPMIQPRKDIIISVARYLKEYISSEGRICGDTTPGGFFSVWRRISRECQFQQFINPHNWKHSYATNGADQLDEWYKGKARLLQLCCLHSSIKMTEKYIKKRYSETIKEFRES
jgi:integrase